MSPNLSLLCDGKKFMWDGLLYATREEAAAAGEACQNKHFEIQLAEQEGKFLLYTRRLVKAAVVTAQ